MPTYAEYRAEVNALFPDIAGKIAIRDKAFGEIDVEGMLRDIRDQIPNLPPKSEEFASAHLTRMAERYIKTQVSYYRGKESKDLQRSSETDDSHASCLRLIDFQEGQEPKAVGAYIRPPCGEAPLEFRLWALGTQDHSLDKYKFLSAGTPTQALDWFFFFHEVCHARRALKPETDSMSEQILHTMEDHICDPFAAMMLTRKFGKQVLPLLRDVSNMRLLRCKDWELKYHTAPALNDSITCLESIKERDLAALDAEAVFRMACSAAIKHTACYSQIVECRIKERVILQEELQKDTQLDNLRSGFWSKDKHQANLLKKEIKALQETRKGLREKAYQSECCPEGWLSRAFAVEAAYTMSDANSIRGRLNRLLHRNAAPAMI